MIQTLMNGQVGRMLQRLRGSRFVSVPGTGDRLRQDYERDGFVAGGRIVNRAQLRRLRAELESIFAQRLDPASGIEHEHHEDGAGGEFLKVYNLHRLSPAFAELVEDPRLIAMVASITGCRHVRLLLDQIHYKPARTGGWNGWHRDMPTFPFIRPYQAVTAWLPLDDATEENGCLRMVPGSHSWGDASDLAGDDWGLGGAIPAQYHGHVVREVKRPVRAGHIHFHHDLTWHCSAPNPTERPRRALSMHFFDADARYRAGGRIVFPELSHGDPMDAVAPLVLSVDDG